MIKESISSIIDGLKINEAAVNKKKYDIPAPLKKVLDNILDESDKYFHEQLEKNQLKVSTVFVTKGKEETEAHLSIIDWTGKKTPIDIKFNSVDENGKPVVIRITGANPKNTAFNVGINCKLAKDDIEAKFNDMLTALADGAAEDLLKAFKSGSFAKTYSNPDPWYPFPAMTVHDDGKWVSIERISVDAIKKGRSALDGFITSVARNRCKSGTSKDSPDIAYDRNADHSGLYVRFGGRIIVINHGTISVVKGDNFKGSKDVIELMKWAVGDFKNQSKAFLDAMKDGAKKPENAIETTPKEYFKL